MRHQRNRRGGALPPGVDPAFAHALAGEGAGRSHQKQNYKTEQLCRQVQRALSLALAGECDDDVLRELSVEFVTAGASSQLIVHIAIPWRQPPISLPDVIQRLARVSGLLRRSVAQAITRKRVPELLFLPVAPAKPEVTP